MGRRRLNEPLIIALTGGIGSGKSAATRLFERLGVPIIDTDQIARDLVRPGSPALREIELRLGSQFLTPDGELDRRALREAVFQNDSLRGTLESILHPRIRGVMEQRLSGVNAPYAIAVIPLLFETGQTGFADRILVVDAPQSEQIERVKTRDRATEEDIRRIMASQSGRETRLRGADDVIDNSRDLDHLESEVARLHRLYLSLAERSRHE